MEKEFIPYEQALELKKPGFNEPCFNRFYTKPQSKMFGVDEKGRHYPIKNTSKKLYTMGEHFVLNDSNVILAPTYSQAFRWFREKHSMKPCFDWHPTEGYRYCIYYSINTYFQECDFNTYEEAELACLIKLIEVIKERNGK